MVKDTSEIVKELALSPDFQTFYNENKEYMVKEDLAQMLNELLQSKGLQKSRVIKNAEISEVYGYQIFSGTRVPERKKLICLTIAMGLDLDETQTLLKCAGYSPLYVKIPFDSIVIYGVCNKMSVVEMNELFYEYGFETLG